MSSMEKEIVPFDGELSLYKVCFSATKVAVVLFPDDYGQLITIHLRSCRFSASYFGTGQVSRKKFGVFYGAPPTPHFEKL